jgi:predicted Abi (CAAX) family protease
VFQTKLRQLQDISLWLPSDKVVMSLVLTTLVYAVVVILTGFSVSFLSVDVVPVWELVRLSFVLILFPSLSEELIYRHILFNPDKGLFQWQNIISLVVYVVMHPIIALTIYPNGNPTFLQAFFLGATLLLGLGAAYLRIKTKTVIAPFLFHYAIVLIWVCFLGGDALLRG